MAPVLELLQTSDDPKKAVEKMNRAINFLQGLDLKEGSGEDIQQAQRAIEELRTAVRTLQELGRAQPTTGPTTEILHRYRFKDQRNSEGFSLRLRGEVVQGMGYMPGLIDDTRDGRPELQRELQMWIERRSIIQTAARAEAAKQGRTLRSDQITPRCDAEIRRILRSFGGEIGRALMNNPEVRAFVDQSGSGGDWIPTDTLPILDEQIKYGRRLAGLFDEISIERDSDLLFLDAGFIPYLRSEPVDDDPAKTPKLSSLKTSKNNVSLREVAVRTLLGRNAIEDAMLAVMPIIQRAGIEAMIAGEEDCLINGHANASHRDTGLATWNPDDYYAVAPGGGSQDHRRGWNGIRQRAADASNQTDRGTFTYATVVSDRHKLKGPKQGPRDVVALPSGKALEGLANMTQFQTLDKYGSDAYNLSGEIGRVNGVPILESQFATDDLNATGIHDGATKDKGGMSMFIRSRLRRIVKAGHGTRVESAVDINTNMVTMVWSRRYTYAWVREGSEKNSHFAYNIG